jgi:hypothetical protein
LRPEKSCRVTLGDLVESRLGAAIEVGAAADERGHERRGTLQHGAAMRAGRGRGRRGRCAQTLDEIGRHRAGHELVPARGALRVRGTPCRVRRVPRRARGGALGGERREARAHLGRDMERRRFRPTEVALGRERLLGAERFAVRVLGVLPLGRAVTDVAAAHDHARTLGLGDRGLERRGERGVVVRIGLHDVPAIRLEALRRVVRERDRRVAVDGDVVVVVHHDEVAQAQMARERRGLVRDPLHEAAVAHDAEHASARRRELGAREARVGHARGEREADRVAEALTERTRRGLDARREAVLGMARCAAVQLTEASQLVERQVVTGQVQQRVEEHRAVPGREHEAIATRPVRIGRIETHEPRPQDVAHVGHAERQTRVSRVRLIDGVHREEADRVDRELIERGVGVQGEAQGGPPVRHGGMGA